MAAIIRVKRRISDGPLENIVVSCKKNRLIENVNTPNEEIVTTELKFAGTVVDKADAISQHIRKAIKKEKLEKEYKRHACQNPTVRSRTISQASSKNKRYFVISKYRSPELDKIDSVNVDDETTSQKTQDATKETVTDPDRDKLYVLYDIEQDVVPITANPQHKDVVTCNSVPMEREKVHHNTNGEYVYDLYYTNRSGFDYRWLESTSSIELYEQILMDDRLSDSDEYVEEDSDSNDENNWRNDYPDEDPHFYDPNEKNSDDDDDYGDYENFGLGSDDEKQANMLAHRIERCFLDDEEEKEEEEREYYKYLDGGGGGGGGGGGEDDDDDDAYSVGKGQNIDGRSYEQYKKDMLKEMNNT
ncbi:probable RNA polymerase II nuclear localization protein SLC7A6OS [Octopus bimaculoides]|uniref:Probable RNA polymerase II nuclear localization protein SLC7A6OS n=1 Tax=Octopus bimaculoides TaxID=37653 RepID=A0A0L8IAK5_OCTBM|nr:probable RNA polymerase II nuclear localization protein SLC7A6OS [Octopus bimaculoides]